VDDHIQHYPRDINALLIMQLELLLVLPIGGDDLGLLGICFWRKGREERNWVELMGEKGG